MSSALAIVGGGVGGALRVEPGVSISSDHAANAEPANNNALLATASGLFAGLVPDPAARNAAVEALILLVARAVAPAPTVESWIGQEEAARRLGTDRQNLDRMLERAPVLPGGPLDVGLGKRHKYQWDPARLGEWAHAYQSWKREQDLAKTKPHPSRKSKQKARPVAEGVVKWSEVGRGE